MMEAGTHVVSLSLGSVAEPSAVVVIDPKTVFERQEDGNRIDHENFFDVVHAERFPAGQVIPVIAERVAEIMADERLARRCRLLLDITSIGTAPVRVFRQRGLHPQVIELTNSSSDKPSSGPRRVPLRDVVGGAQVVLQTGRLKVASKLDLAPTLVRDLQGFDPQPMSRGLDLRGGKNSDLVFALAVALWWADKLTWARWPGRGQPREQAGPLTWMAH